MLRLAGRVCDGVRLHGFATRNYLEEVALPQIEAGLRQARPAPLQLRGLGRRLRRHGPGAETERQGPGRMGPPSGSAWYASTPAYRVVLEPHGLEDLGKKLSEMARRQEFDAMAALIPDEVLNLFAAIGTYDEIAGAIADRFGGLVDTVGIPFPADADPGAVRAVVQAVQAIPGQFEGFRTETPQAGS